MLKSKRESNLLKNAYLQLLSSLFLIFSLSHCSHLSEREKPETIHSSQKKVLHLHKAEVAQKKNLQSEGRIRLKHGKRKYVFDFLLGAKTPSKSRFEASHPLSGTLAILVTNPSEFIYHEIEGDKTYRGKKKIPVLPTYFPYELTTEELVGCFTHSFPLPQKKSNTRLTYNKKDNAYTLTFLHKEKTWRAMLDPTHFYLLSIEIRNPNKTVYLSLKYEQFQKTKAGFYFPKMIHISSPSNKADLELEFSETSFPLKLNPALFVFEK